ILQALAAESMLQHRTLHWTSDILTVIGLAIIVLAMVFSWRRFAAGTRVAMLIAMAASVEAIAVGLQAKLPLVLDTSLFHTAIIAYMAAIALDEIDFHGLLGRIAVRPFPGVTR